MHPHTVIRYDDDDNSKPFQLPDDIFLFIYGTSNYGAEHLNEMKNRNLGEAREIIVNAMRDKNIAECNIRRLGTPVPFFYIEKNDAIKTIFERCRKDEENPDIPINAKSHYISSINQCATINDHELFSFIEYCVSGTYIKSQGITGSIEFVFKQFDHNSCSNDDYFRELLRKNSRKNKISPISSLDNDIIKRLALAAASKNIKPPVLSFHIINCSEEGMIDMTKDRLIELYPFMKDVLNNTLKAPDIELCIANKSPIAYILMKYEEFGLSNINIISPLSPIQHKQYSSNIINNNTELENELLRERRILIHKTETLENSNRILLKEREEEEKKDVKKKKKKERKPTLKLTKHKWELDPILSNRKYDIYSCICRLNPKKHYRRPCSSGSEECLGDGFRYYSSRGYCKSCLKK